ncbi:hypothetical protein DFR70_12633 [Nocardia tenerifensis]|uniref:Uncharacterized protein n=2 Tax=Nocardia tenerifensis TaxID=228006 RepID=A0A318JMA0_9NOCA|nr:hypothetical protein DFR70_12633 [Nocardia tenerifensis]
MELTTHPPVQGQLPLWESGAETMTPATRTRPAAAPRICPNPGCGYRAKGVSARGRLREDLQVVWLVPDPAGSEAAVERRYCHRCCPRPPHHQIADVECAACDCGGPLLVDALAAALITEGIMPDAVRRWLEDHGWREQGTGALVCPDHLSTQ